MDEDEVKRVAELAGVPDTHAIVEGSISRVIKHVHGELPFAILTAFRGNLSAKENAERNADMAAQIRSMNLGYLRVDGSYVEEHGGKVSEASFMVIGDRTMKEKDFILAMERLGAMYDQDSILIGTPKEGVRLVATVDNDFVGARGSEKPLGAFTPTRVGDYFSELKGRPFVFRSIDESYEPKSRRDLGFMSGLAVEHNRKRK